MLYGKSPFLHENPNIMYGKIMEEEPSFPRDFKYSDESTDLIKKLLKKSNSDRIGYDDEQEIFTHPWFNNIDFAKLIAKKLSAMIIPCVEDHTPLKKSRSKTEETMAEDEENEKSFSLDLSFEKEKSSSKQKIKGVNDSMEDFSYFEEEGWVDTAIEDNENLLEEFEEERRVQLLTNIEEYTEYSMDEDNQIKDRDNLRSPPGESVNANSEVDEKESYKRKGSIDSQISEYNKTQKDREKDCEKSERKGSDHKTTATMKKSDSSDKVNEANKSNKVSPSHAKLDKINGSREGITMTSPYLVKNPSQKEQSSENALLNLEASPTNGTSNGDTSPAQ